MVCTDRGNSLLLIARTDYGYSHVGEWKALSIGEIKGVVISAVARRRITRVDRPAVRLSS